MQFIVVATTDSSSNLDSVKRIPFSRRRGLINDNLMFRNVDSLRTYKLITS